MEDIAIKVDNVSKVYGSTAAVEQLSFEVKSGEVHGFLGPNGAGKSTTMKMIAGLLRPSRGNTWVRNTNVQLHPEKIKADIGILLENPPLYKDMVVKDYLAFVSRLHKVPSQSIGSAVDEAIAKLHLEEVANRLIGNLSKGFKQRVGVAQAIVHNPAIVILDEPTVGLDPEAVIKMRELIKGLSQGHTVLLSSHLLHEISLICDRVTIISHGKLQASGPISEIQHSLSKKRIIEVELLEVSEPLIVELKKMKWIEQVTCKGNVLTIYAEAINDYRPEIAKLIVDRGYGLLSMKQNEVSLEDIFISMTKGAQQ